MKVFISTALMFASVAANAQTPYAGMQARSIKARASPEIRMFSASLQERGSVGLAMVALSPYRTTP